MGRRARVGLGLAWMLMFAPACFEDAPGVDPSGAEVDGSTAALTSSSSADPTDTDAVTGTTVGPADSSGSVGPGDTSGSGSGSSSGSGSGDTMSTTSGPPPDFFDDFDRANNDAIGNGWMEKLAPAWRILGDDVAAQDSIRNPYYDFLVSRPLPALDVQLQMEFRITVQSPNNEPHLVLRAQESSLRVGTPYHAYILVPRPSMDDLCIMRFLAEVFPMGMMCTTLPAGGLTMDGPYRLTFSAQGDQPVQLEGMLEWFNGAAFEEVASVFWSDDDVGILISDPGYYGFSAGTGAAQLVNYRLDNFEAHLEF